MFERIMGGIQEFFADVLPHEFCVPCFLKGALEGAVIGLGALLLIASLPAWAATATAVGLAALGVAGMAVLAARWGGLNDNEKSEALGGIAGGALVGGLGPRGGPTLPGMRLLTTPEGMTTVVLVPTTATVTAGGGAAAGVVGAGSAAMMTSGGSGGGSSDRPEKSAADIHQGRQNIHKPGTNENKTSQQRGDGHPPTTWSDPDAADALTLQAYREGRVTQSFPDGSPKEIKWNAGRGVGNGGQTQVTVKLNQKGQLHGFPSGPASTP